MAYTHTTRAELKTELAHRLGDASRVFWVDAELGIHIDEALRTYGLLSGFWRERGTLTASPALAFYDIARNLSNGSAQILQPSVTDRDILRSVQYALLENASTQSSWVGTEMFRYPDVVNAVQNRINQFLSDTGVVLTRTLMAVQSPAIGRQPLHENTIDVRRAAWIGAAPFNYYSTLWRCDEMGLTAASQNWSVDPVYVPVAYSVFTPPPVTLQLAPHPSHSGQLDMLTVNSVAINPASNATITSIPDDLTPAIKWGALADLLSIDGQARDIARAMIAEQRYQQFVQVARLVGSVIHAELNGVPLIPTSLADLEAAEPNWQNVRGEPSLIAAPGLNMIALYPVPNHLYSITLDVLRKTPVPAIDADPIRIGREQLDAIVDYAEHIALFKVAGQEFHATQQQADAFLKQAVAYNQRLAAAVRYIVPSRDSSRNEEFSRPRRMSAQGVGATPSGAEANRAG